MRQNGCYTSKTCEQGRELVTEESVVFSAVERGRLKANKKGPPKRALSLK